MNENNAKKLTLEDLIALKERPIQQTREVYVPGMGGTLTLQRQSLVTYQKAVDAINRAQGAEESLRATFQCIYTFCPMLHEQALQDAYECQAPPDIVPKIFREDAGDISRVFGAILEMYGDGQALRDQVKN